VDCRQRSALFLEEKVILSTGNKNLAAGKGSLKHINPVRDRAFPIAVIYKKFVIVGNVIDTVKCFYPGFDMFEAVKARHPPGSYKNASPLRTLGSNRLPEPVFRDPDALAAVNEAFAERAYTAEIVWGYKGKTAVFLQECI